MTTVVASSDAFAELTAVPKPTPRVVVRSDRLRHNIARMQRFCDDHGVALRPHAKTHKLREIAALQLGAGAVGLTVATLAEAEAFVASGCEDVFIAYPVIGLAESAERVARLASSARVTVGVDSAQSLHLLHASRLHRQPDFRLRIEIECGLRRTGVTPVDAAELAREAQGLGFAVQGVFTFPGHSYAVDGAAPAAADEARALAAAAEAFAKSELDCAVRSGGSTPSLWHLDSSVVTEARPGVYVFNDAQQIALGTVEIDDVALVVVTTVVSTPTPDRFVVDAGSKTIAADRPGYVSSYGLLPTLPGARVTGLWEHHAVVDASELEKELRPCVGDRLVVVPNHVCTAINLTEYVEVWPENEIWRLVARGSNP